MFPTPFFSSTDEQGLKVKMLQKNDIVKTGPQETASKQFMVSPRGNSMRYVSFQRLPNVAFAAPHTLGTLRERYTHEITPALDCVSKFSHVKHSKRARFNNRVVPMSCAKIDDSSSVKASSETFTWCVGQSSREEPLDALQEAISKAGNTLTALQRTVSVAFVFINSSFEGTRGADMSRVVQTVKKTLAMRRLITPQTKIFGSTSAEYIESDQETSASVALAHFPDTTEISTFCIDDQNGFDIDWKQRQWHDLVGLPPKTDRHLHIFMLQHPDYEQIDDLLSGLDFSYPGVQKFGASAGKTNALHECYLFHTNGTATKQGIIGLALSSPDVQMNVMVAQGARGIGPLLEVLAVKDGNEIVRVREVNTPGTATAPPMILLDMWANTDNISYDDRLRSREYLLLGVEVSNIADLAAASISTTADKQKTLESQKPVEMVIRKVVGFNEATNSLFVEGNVPIGSRVRFQVRDDKAARAELTSLFNKMSLEGSSKAMEGMSLMGALMLVDTERGANLFGTTMPNADRAMFLDRFPVPLSILSSDRQIGPLPAGGLLGAAGNTFSLSASALYITFYGRTSNVTT
ncbi:unnamed protein product [Agarophyton chilense]